ncbi:hypothetical protein A1O7_02361 [Cladophialophora yegresii CBS 114405]|uniref:Uncharacterized protein n=1 Tax=Cladophialophora yegresii CBS 114405 TaxID=1182544 RepID=W9WAC1_9EURO|nr:uncharacterized protein A1O7_02361 [Cladophialophora yegresii CBS 114405]EXJ61930.1 hypothetical protein A1O7_02361 [Cladophialophora yegresii CBS 114405]
MHPLQPADLGAACPPGVGLRVGPSASVALGPARGHGTSASARSLKPTATHATDITTSDGGASADANAEADIDFDIDDAGGTDGGRDFPIDADCDDDVENFFDFYGSGNGGNSGLGGHGGHINFTYRGRSIRAADSRPTYKDPENRVTRRLVDRSREIDPLRHVPRRAKNRRS